MNLVKAIWNLLKVGGVVADPAKWKAHQVSVNQVIAALGGVLLLLKGTKYDPHMDNSTVTYIAGGIFGLVNWLFTVVTTDKIGVFGKPAVSIPAPSAAPVPAAAADPAPVNVPAVVRAPAPTIMRGSLDGSTDENGYLRG